MSSVKEPHFFSRITPVSGGMEYIPVVASEADYLSLFRGAESYNFVGESSTSYMWDTLAASRIRDKVGTSGSIVAIIRHPVDRAYSHYLNNVREGYERRPFTEALRQELSNRETVPWHFAYIGCSDYPRQLDAYTSEFGASLTVIQFERMVNETEATCGELSAALGLTVPIDPACFTRENPYSVPVNGVGGFAFHNEHIRYWARRLTSSPLRQMARGLVLRPTPKPNIDPVARRLLDDCFAEMPVDLERRFGIRPSWDLAPAEHAAFPMAETDGEAPA